VILGLRKGHHHTTEELDAAKGCLNCDSDTLNLSMHISNMTTIDLSGIEEISSSLYAQMFDQGAVYTNFADTKRTSSNFESVNTKLYLNIGDRKPFKSGFAFEYNTLLELKLHALTTVGLMFCACCDPALSYLSIPKLHVVNNTLNITNNALLRKFSAPSLISVGSVNVRGSFTNVEFRTSKKSRGTFSSKART
jgi:hypothetical protein